MSEFNPYTPPTAPLAQPMALRRATRGQRFGTFLLDTFFTYLLGFAVGIVFVVLGQERALDAIPGMLLGTLIMLAYYVPQEAYTGRTLGKWIMKTQVVNEAGEPITARQAVLRTLCRLIPFEAFSCFGGDGEGPRGWHDSLPKTLVVTTRAL